MSPAEVRPDAPIPLPAQCGTAAAEALYETLLRAADTRAFVRIDASEVGSLGQAAVQLLLAVRKDAEARGSGFELLAPSPHVSETLARCGLAGSLSPLPRHGQPA